MLAFYSFRIAFVVVCLGAALSASQTTFAQSCTPPPAGLVSFWPGDRTANDLQGTNHGTLVNGATFTSGEVGPAFSFDGLNDLVSIPSINIGTTFSIELWIYPTRNGGFQHLVSNDYQSTNYGALYFVGNHIEYWQGSTVRAFTPGGSVPANVWTHVALTYDGNVAQLYLNGAASGGPSIVHMETFNNQLKFGYTVVASDSYFQGRLDEISLYNSVLSAAAIQSIFNAGSMGKCVAPALIINDSSVIEGNSGTTNMNFVLTSIRSTVAAMVDYATADGTATAPSDYMATSGTLSVPPSGTATVSVLVNGDTMLEPNETFFVNLSNPVNAFIADGQGIGTIFSDDCVAAPLGIADWYKGEGDANDSVGGNNGTLQNGATFAVGNTGQAFSLDGINDFVSTPTINLGSAFTVELWIYPTIDLGYQELVSNNYLSANYGSFYFNIDHLEYWQGTGQRAVSSGTIPLNTWTHVALTYDGAVDRLYVNGSASGSPSPTHTETFNNQVRFGYAVNAPSSYFQGQLDEITLYNRTLSATEIQTIYSAFGGGKCSGAVGNNWTGAVSSDWHTPANWSTAMVPTISSDVLIPANGVTNEPTISSADVTINSLNAAANRTLTVNGGRMLTVNNDLINNAALAGAGTINSQGSAINNAGTISAANFNFSRAGGQGLSGSGSFSSNTATVLSGSTLSLVSNHQFSSLVIQSGATLDITARTLSLSGSFTNNGTFSITDSTVVANGTAPQTLTNANYRNFTANNTTGVNLGSDATVSHILTLTSDLTTGGFTLSVPWITATAAGNADVVGNVRCTGSGGAQCSYGNFFNTIANNSGIPPTDITVNLVKSAPGGAMGFPTAVQRTYTITPNGGSGYSATVRLHYLDSELNGNSEASMDLWRFDSVSQNWQRQVATSRDTTNNWVGKSGVTQFSPWTFNSTVPTAAPATISGQITTGDGTPLGGVLLTLTSGSQLRRAITDNAGNYLFANVDTDSFYTVTPLRVNYVFNPVQRSFTLLANKTDAVFTAISDAMPSANPLDTMEFFVRQQYLDFLGREPDQGGWEYWIDQIRQCGTDQTCLRQRRVAVSNAFFYEAEYQRTGAYVYRLYRTAFGNDQPFANPDTANIAEARKLPSYASFIQDRARVVDGSSLQQTQLDLANDFVQRAEFLEKYPASLSGPEYVDALLASMRNDSAVDLTSQRSALIDLFNQSGRGVVLYRLADDNGQTNPINNRGFIDAEYNRSFVYTQYAGYLKRDADLGGFLFWWGKINEFPVRDVAIQHTMVCSFITSREYQQRFASIITRTNAECGR